jgi:hypothetical protein
MLEVEEFKKRVPRDPFFWGLGDGIMLFYLDLTDSSAYDLQHCRFSFIACIDSSRTLLKEDYWLTFFAAGRFSGAGIMSK